MKRILIALFFLISITAVNANSINQEIKNDLNFFANLSAKYLYEVDEEQLLVVLKPSLKIHKHIRALKIIENIDNEIFITFYKDGSQSVFNQPIPEELKRLDNISSDITFNNERIGKIVLYFKNELKIQLTKEEKQWLEKNSFAKIGMMDYWPHDDNGISLHTEVLKLINKYSGANLVPVKYSAWAEGFSRATKGDELHGIMGLGWSKERETRYFYYTPAYNFTPSYLVTRRDNSTIKSLDDLADKTAYLKKGSITHNIMGSKSPKAKIIDKASIDDMYRSLSSSNEASALIADFINKDKLETYNLKIVKEIYTRFNESAIGVHHKYPELSSILNKAFKIIPKKEFSILRDKNWGVKKSDNINELSLHQLNYLKKKKIINICINPNWDPIEFRENGVEKGISIDILKIIQEKLGIKYHFIKTSSWTESQQFLQEKKCDILPSAIKTTKREEFANFTLPYLKYDLVIITTADKPLVSSLESITSKTMSRKKGSGLISKLKKKYPYIKIYESDGHHGALQDVIDKKVYFTIATIPVFSYYKSKYGLKNLQVAGYTKMKYNLSIAVRKDDKNLLEILNKSLKSIPKSTFDVVHDKWASVKVIKQTNWTLIFQIVGVIIIVLLFVIYNNQKLKKLVNLRTVELRDLLDSLEEKVEQRTEALNKQKQVAETALDLQVLSEEKTRLLLTSVGEGIFGVGSDGLVNFINPAALEMLQYNENEILGQKIHAIIHHTRIDGSNYPVEQCPMFHAYSEGKVSQIDDEILWRKDGSSFPVEYKARPVIRENIISGSVVTFSDITERKNAHNLLLKQQLEIQEIHKHTRDSIEYAALIQGALIPDNNIFQKYFQDFFAIWHPKDIVGGDIYLVEELSKNEVIIMVIDCTGHGVPGAFVTMLVKAVERQLTANLHKDKMISPANILSIFNKSIKHLLQQEDVDSISNAGFDGGILYYNEKEKVIRFAGANTPLFLIQHNELKTIKGDRHSIGYKKSDANYEFTDHTIDVSSPTQIYITTDGYLDQNGGDKGFPFGKKRFTKLILENAGESFADQQEFLLYELQKYEKGEERNDDVTVVGLKI
ncbi:MAG: transporter substrate-binding domain-containing protein [gamma proteobacterium symbiont of Taylorina sp.]|nr:transporter substrate-binding domain-containing protein [gamma proteobacterium symbiont of Taylorina sp.]